MKAIIVTLLSCLALNGCKVENKEGDTVVEPAKKETVIIDKTTKEKN